MWGRTSRGTSIETEPRDGEVCSKTKEETLHRKHMEQGVSILENLYISLYNVIK